MERKGEFPKRVKLGENSSGHYEDEVEEWIRSRIRGGSRFAGARKARTEKQHDDASSI
jgi:hypothetical protein